MVCIRGGDTQIDSGKRKPFFWSARLWLKEMSESQPRTERRTITPVKAKKRVGNTAPVACAQNPAAEICAGPRGAKALAFDGEIGNFVEGIDSPELWIEFQTIDNSDGIFNENMLRTQVAVAIDDLAGGDTRGDQFRLRVEEAALGPVNPPRKPN